MIGAIIGDIVGSRFEFNNHRSKDFELFHKSCFATDDSIMTIAIMDALLYTTDVKELGKQAVRSMRKIGQNYPNCGYGGRFMHWMFTDNPQPYNSYGNGAAMRISPVAYFARDLQDVYDMSAAVTGVTHNHPEGLKGAEVTAACIWAALHKWDKSEIADYVKCHYCTLDFTLDQIRPTYRFNETCQETVPQAIEAFLESTDFEDAIRNAISIGGDSDTLAAITGSIAGAFYGVPDWMEEKALTYLDTPLAVTYLMARQAYHDLSKIE